MKTKSQKQSIVKELKQNFDNAKAVIFLNLHKLSASNLFKLKRELKNNEASIKVAKKTLFGVANSDIDKEKIKGPFALIFDFSTNLKPFNILGKFKKELQLEVFGGSLGDKFLTEKEVWDITALPTDDALKTKLVFVLKSRLQSAVFTLKSPLNKLIISLNQINSQKSVAK